MTSSSNSGTGAQTFDGGTMASAKYKYGMSGQELSEVDPNRSVIVIAAEKGSGKSHFVQSNPDAFIINCDHKTISYKVDNKPTCLATIFPMHINGKNYNGNTEMKSFGWEDVKECISYLCSISKQPDAPKTVVLDTITAARSMVMDWLVRTYKKDNFEQLGERGWAKINNEIASTVDTLVAAGYGVQLLFHVRKTYIQEKNGDKRPVAPGDLANKVMYGIDCSPGQWTALQSKPSMVLGMVRESKPIRQKDGRIVNEMQTYLDIGFTDRFDDCFGSMYILPNQIVLPSDNTWGHFVNVFKEHNHQA